MKSLSLFDLLESICTELNKALGGLNNLEPSIDEDANLIKIIDASYVPVIKTENEVLELYGYSESQNESNFIYDFNIKTEITNDFATMASVGSTAGGYVKGTENTMFSKWNKGLIDRFKDDFLPAAQTEDKSKELESEPPKIYAEEFWNKRYAPFGVTAPQDIENDLFTEDSCALSPEIIDKNLDIVAEFYKYCQFKIQKEEAKYASPTTGFVPVSLGLTMEGLSGIKIYNYLEVSTRFLPQNYPDSLKFIIKGVDHKIANGRWETGIETVVIANNFNKDGSQIITYPKIKSIVKGVIDEGIASAKNKTDEGQSTPPRPKPVASETTLALNAVSTGTGTTAAGVGGQGRKTVGTAGKDAKPEDLSEDALSVDTIETIVKDSGAEISAIRTRIVRIAASYVGQFESLPPQNPGWWDPDYQTKFQNASPQLYGANWYKTAPWCLWFCQVVWREAYNTGNKYVGNWEIAPEFKDQYKQIWNGKLQKGAVITAAHSTARNGFQSIKKYITLDDAISGRALPEPGDIALYSYGHGDIVIKPFVTDGKLTGFSSVGGNTGASDANNGGETHYYAKKGDWKQVWGFCKVVTIANQDVDYASSPLVGLPEDPSTAAAPTPDESANAFNNLTYNLSLIWTIKDNYKDGKPLFKNAKAFNPKGKPASELFNEWFDTNGPQYQYKKLTQDDKIAFKHYKDALLAATAAGENKNITFKSDKNKKVKTKVINSAYVLAKNP
jgi:hypothetical protein